MNDHVYRKLWEQEKIIAEGGKLAIDAKGVGRYLLPEDVWADRCVISNEGKKYYKDGLEVRLPYANG